MGARHDVYCAAALGDLALVESHLAQGPELMSTRDQLGRTPLHWAAAAGHSNVGELLLTKGAHVNARDRRNYTPLTWACFEDNQAVADLLRRHGGTE